LYSQRLLPQIQARLTAATSASVGWIRRASNKFSMRVSLAPYRALARISDYSGLLAGSG